MSFDIAAHLGTMTRTVATVDRDGKQARAIVASRVYDTDPDDLWDALTKKERIARWFLPISGDLRPGGRYQFEGNAGGTITRCDPPQAIEATWEMHGEVSWVTVTLAAEGNGTRLELTHVAHVPEEMWARFGPGAVGAGWDGGFLGLAIHLADPTVERPPEADPTWPGSPEGKAFFRAASDAWGEAAIAAGMPEAEARAAAERTRQFYTGDTKPEA